MMQHVRPALVTMVLFTLLLGLAYPLAMTGLAGMLFPSQAGGSLVKDQAGHVIGSSLIAQAFTKPEYLHPRPSAAGAGYDAMSSAGSNLGPLDKKLIDQVRTNADAIRKEDGPGDIPADAVTNSGSGLDPDVSPAYAHLQADRIAKARGRTVSEVLAIVDARTGARFLGFIGQPHVNVLEVNRALDARYPVGQPKAS
jgi:potassium-transporting ATPase KdpC subunit